MSRFIPAATMAGLNRMYGRRADSPLWLWLHLWGLYVADAMLDPKPITITALQSFLNFTGGLKHELQILRPPRRPVRNATTDNRKSVRPTQ